MNNIAIITEHELITYQQLEKMLQEFQKYLVDRATVLVLAENQIGSLVAYLSCIEHHHIPLMISKSMNMEAVLSYIQTYGFQYLWIPRECDSYNQLKTQHFLAKWTHIYSKYGYELFCISKKQVCLDSELALLLTTSGTTGGNKLVRISKKNMASNTRAIVKYMKLSEKDIAITSLPMNYTYGLSVINSHLYVKGTILLTERKVIEKEFWNFFEKYSGTFFAGVPYTYEMIRKLGIWKKNIKSLKLFTVAGGKIGETEGLFCSKYAEEFQKEFLVMYGQTEATARISYLPWKEHKNKQESIGIPIPDGNMWIENKDGKILAPYEIGEIVYQGDNVAMGYAMKKQDLSKGYEWKNILHTKDLGYQDEDGYFYIQGRSDRVVKLYGHRIDMEQLEQKIEAKYPDLTVKCNIEKCMDESIPKRLVLNVKCNREEINIERIQSLVEKEVLLARKMILVVIQR